MKMNTRSIYFKFPNYSIIWGNVILFLLICDISQIYMNCGSCLDFLSSMMCICINIVLKVLLKDLFHWWFIKKEIIWTSESLFSQKTLQCLCVSFFLFRLLNNKVMVMETPSPQCVGREFVRQYYTLLNEVPLHLHR